MPICTLCTFTDPSFTGDILASGGDDGNIILWTKADKQGAGSFGEDRSDDQETWRVKKMCSAMGADIYDLAWSPDAQFFITGSMDNIARIYNASTGEYHSYPTTKTAIHN